MRKSIRSTISIGSLVLFIVVFLRTISTSLTIFREEVTQYDIPSQTILDVKAVIPEIKTDRNFIRTADGHFNGLPIYYVPPTTKQKTSSIHCVGENFHSDAWHYRSCEIHHFCYSIKNGSFFVSASSGHTEIEELLSRRNETYHGSISSRLNVNVSLKSASSNLLKPSKKSGPSWSWQPVIRPPPTEGYFELPPEIVWTPIHTLNEIAINPGHLLWDYLLPIYTLLSMFGYESNSTTPLVTDGNQYCAAGRKSSCFKMLSKFTPLLGVAPGSYSNMKSIGFNTWGPYDGRSSIVCSRRALVGITMLSDHGRNKHGQDSSDYEQMRNVGRGPELYRFRNFMLGKMGIGTGAVDDASVLKAPYQILVSQNSTTSPKRQRSFQTQIAALQQAYSSEQVVVKPLILTDLTLEEQLRVLSQSKVYIGVMGGGAAFASFLPRGSTVLLFFDDVHDWSRGKGSRPVMMDWDFFNNAAYLRVHWFPLSTMESKEDVKLLVETIRLDLKAQL